MAAAGRPRVSPELINEDLPVMPLTSLVRHLLTKGTISRLEGGLLFGLYILYVTDNVLPDNLVIPSDEFDWFYSVWFFLL